MQRGGRLKVKLINQCDPLQGGEPVALSCCGGHLAGKKIPTNQYRSPKGNISILMGVISSRRTTLPWLVQERPLNGLMSVKINDVRFGLHSHLISTPLNTYGRLTSDMLLLSTTIIEHQTQEELCSSRQ